jgi:hypothetical protein
MVWVKRCDKYIHWRFCAPCEPFQAWPYINQGDGTLYPEGDPNRYPVSDVFKVTSPATGSSHIPPPIDAVQNGNSFSAQFVVQAAKPGVVTLKGGLVGNCGNNLRGRVLLVQEDGVTTLTVTP